MNTYQHSNIIDSSQQQQPVYNNGINPILPSSTSTSNYQHGSRSNYTFPTQATSLLVSRNTICPVYVTTYITLHLDTISKILNHILYITLFCNIMIFTSSFSISYLNNHNYIGFNTVFITFVLCIITIINLLIINNNHISALSIFAPTTFMIGFAIGITCNAIILTYLLSSTYKAASQLCHQILVSSTTNNHISSSNTTDTTYKNFNMNDPILYDTCLNHSNTISSIRFWSFFINWCNIIIVSLFIVGRHELSANTTYHYSYDPVATNNNNHPNTASSSTGTSTSTGTFPNGYNNDTNLSYPPEYDFEENFRRQQQAILGNMSQPSSSSLFQQPQQQHRTAMFVGDYSTIPEVTTTPTPTQQQQSSTNTNNSNNNKNTKPQILSV